MKKILAAALSIALASSISLALVACGDDGGNTGGGGGTAPVVSEKVTKDQWESAFTANNFANGTVKVVRTMKGDIRIDDDNNTANGTVTTTTDVVIDGDKQYMKVSYSAKGEKALTDLYAGVEAEEKYTKAYDISEPDYPLYIYYGKKGPGGDSFSDKEAGKVHWQILYNWDSKGLFDSQIEYILQLGQYYDAFEYNDDKKGYTAKSEAYDQLKGFVLKFKDYKLIALESDELENIGYTTKETYTMTYGNQTVTLPTITATSKYDGTWKTSYIYNSITETTYNIDDTVEYYLGNDPVELKGDTMKITFKNDGTATYKYLDTTNTCVWDYFPDSVFLASNNLPLAKQWHLDYDEENELLSMSLAPYTDVKIYLEKEGK